MDQIGESKIINRILDVVEFVAIGIELLAVAVIVTGIIVATYIFLTDPTKGRARDRDMRYRERLARNLLIGLEVLVAADVIRTVALDSTIQSVTLLAILVLIRTFLSWALVVEIENRWPWQRVAPDRDPNANPPER